MSGSSIYFFVEGRDDKQFLEKTVKPLLKEKYSQIDIVQYAGLTPEKRSNWLKSMKGLNADYLILADMNGAPCVTKRKNLLRKEFKTRIADDRIIIVIREIESWYLAGLDEAVCKTLKVKKYIHHTDSLSKENVVSIKPDKYMPNEFMGVMLSSYSLDVAVTRNQSLNYFCYRHIKKEV